MSKYWILFISIVTITFGNLAAAQDEPQPMPSESPSASKDGQEEAVQKPESKVETEKKTTGLDELANFISELEKQVATLKKSVADLDKSLKNLDQLSTPNKNAIMALNQIALDPGYSLLSRRAAYAGIEASLAKQQINTDLAAAKTSLSNAKSTKKKLFEQHKAADEIHKQFQKTPAIAVKLSELRTKLDSIEKTLTPILVDVIHISAKDEHRALSEIESSLNDLIRSIETQQDPALAAILDLLRHSNGETVFGRLVTESDFPFLGGIQPLLNAANDELEQLSKNIKLVLEHSDPDEIAMSFGRLKDRSKMIVEKQGDAVCWKGVFNRLDLLVTYFSESKDKDLSKALLRLIDDVKCKLPSTGFDKILTKVVNADEKINSYAARVGARCEVDRKDAKSVRDKFGEAILNINDATENLQAVAKAADKELSSFYRFLSELDKPTARRDVQIKLLEEKAKNVDNLSAGLISDIALTAVDLDLKLDALGGLAKSQNLTMLAAFVDESEEAIRRDAFSRLVELDIKKDDTFLKMVDALKTIATSDDQSQQLRFAATHQLADLATKNRDKPKRAAKLSEAFSAIINDLVNQKDSVLVDRAIEGIQSLLQVAPKPEPAKESAEKKDSEKKEGGENKEEKPKDDAASS